MRRGRKHGRAEEDRTLKEKGTPGGRKRIRRRGEEEGRERRGKKEGRERRKMRKDEERKKKYEGSRRVEEGWRKRVGRCGVESPGELSRLMIVYSVIW